MRCLRHEQLVRLTLAMSLVSLAVTAAPRAGLVQQAYLWQRDWSGPAVREAILARAGQFDGLVVLGAEVTWPGREPRVVRVPLDYQTLKAAGCPLGLALRIGPYAGPLRPQGQPIEALADLAESLVREANGNGVSVAELQIDFDCAESKLAGYLAWVQSIRSRVLPVPVILTALPSWLSSSSFKPLVSAADGYVLQVHSLERPKAIAQSFSLCDAAAARRAVERASSVGVPFRIALPTYGYVMVFDSAGQFLGLSAEGILPRWPEDVRTREVRADPAEMAALTRFWSANPPVGMQGLIWYRLPTDADVLNWPWPTLQAVMQGRPPREHVQVETSAPEPGLVEVSLLNDGELDQPLSMTLLVRWKEGRLAGADALRGFELADAGATAVRFEPAIGTSSFRLRPGQRRPIGWLRFETEQKVQIELAYADASKLPTQP
jgi:hypothetical protein